MISSAKIPIYYSSNGRVNSLYPTGNVNYENSAHFQVRLASSCNTSCRYPCPPRNPLSLPWHCLHEIPGSMSRILAVLMAHRACLKPPAIWHPSIAIIRLFALQYHCPNVQVSGFFHVSILLTLKAGALHPGLSISQNYLFRSRSATLRRNMRCSSSHHCRRNCRRSQARQPRGLI